MIFTVIRFLCVLTLTAALAAPIAAAMDKKEVEAIIRDWVKAHPQELTSSVKQFEAQQKVAAQEAAVKQALANRFTVPSDGSPSTGPANAPITLVEFTDFQCPYCARSVATISQVLRNHDGQIRMVSMQAPLPFHAKAPDAAKAAMAAEAQGKYWEYRETLMAKQNEWSQAADSKPNFIAYAKELGLDLKRFEKDLDNPGYAKRLASDRAVASALGVQGTPTFFINGAKIVGAQELGQFERVVAEVMKDKPGK